MQLLQIADQLCPFKYTGLNVSVIKLSGTKRREIKMKKGVLMNEEKGS